MARPFAVIGFTMFAALLFICILGEKSAWVLLALCAFLLPVCLSVKEIRKGKAWIAMLIVVCISASLYLAAYRLYYLPQLGFSGREISVEGRITDLPEMRYGKYYYVISVSRADAEKLKTPLKLRLVRSEKLDAEVYDNVSFSGKTYTLGADGGATKLGSASSGVFVGISTYGEVKVSESKSVKPPNYYVLKFRQILTQNIKRVIPRENCGVAIAVLLGDKSYLSSNDYENIINAGVSHLMCVSGLHLSVLSYAVLKLLSKFKCPRRKKFIITIIFVIFFTALCGFTKSAVRAGIMLIIYLVGEMISDEADSLNSLGFAAMVILLNPFNSLNIGFILSFTSTLAVITLGSGILARLKARCIKPDTAKVLKILFGAVEILVISLCVNLFCIPASIIFFKKITIIGIAANVLILPFASMLLISCGITAAFGAIPLSVSGIVLYPFVFTVSAVSKYVLKLTASLAAVPWGSVYAGRNYVLVFMALAAVFAAICLMMKKERKTFLKYGCAVLALIFVTMSSGDYLVRSNECEIDVYALSGSVCIGVKCGGKFILIDCGNNQNTLNKISDALFSSDSSEIDCLFLTSSKRGESGEIGDLIDNISVAGVNIPDDTYLKNIVGKYPNTALNVAPEGMVSPADGLKISYFYGDSSLILLEYNSQKVLFCTSSSVDFSSVPKKFSSYNYLILKGAVNNDVVNSGINGIIELTGGAKNKSADSVLTALGYNVLSVADGCDAQIKICGRNTVFGSKNSWV